MEQFTGSITALVTPFKGGKVDESTLQNLVNRQIDAGTQGLVPVGTTGESATLNDDEHERVVALSIEAAGGRVPIMAGVGSNDTAYSISMAQRVEKLGANALLAVTGYYNRPNQTGLFAHYKALHDATSLPIYIYNIPARTTVTISVETLAKLSNMPRIVGVKDATGDLARVALQRHHCADDFVQLSGEDMTAVGFNAMGGQGCISVSSNVAPELCAQMQSASLKGEFAEAVSFQDKLAPLHHALFSDASPAPAKYALSLMGLCSDEMRLPMVTASDEAKAKVRAALEELDLIG